MRVLLPVRLRVEVHQAGELHHLRAAASSSTGTRPSGVSQKPSLKVETPLPIP